MRQPLFQSQGGGVVHRGDPHRLPSATHPAHGSGMEINGEIAVDLGALAETAERWLASADQLAAELERLSVEGDGSALGPAVAEAFAKLVRAWTRAGGGLAENLADHAAALAASASEYDAADSRAALRQTAAFPGLAIPPTGGQP